MRDYVYVDQGEQQYAAALLKSGTPVNARYRKALCECDVGNPFIEALPHPLQGGELIENYSAPLSMYDYESEIKKDSLVRLSEIGQLRQLRVALPFHGELEYRFYDTLCTSYRNRTCVKEPEDYKYRVKDDQDVVHYRLVGNVADAANAGFALLGDSGCGKSSAMNMLLKKYPQVVYHTFDGERVPQITYLVVCCLPNSNFGALYASIGRAIDMALNVRGVYEREVSKQQGLGNKLRKVMELIEVFCVGMIVFDEIQLINFSASKENSFEALMVLANQTKVAICVIGTEDAYEKLFTTERTARRVGTVIHASVYCEQKEVFAFLAKKLFRYQWFDERVELTDEILDMLYENTNGTVDQLVGMYMAMHYEYLSSRVRPQINGAFVAKVCKLYNSGMRRFYGDDKLWKQHRVEQVSHDFERELDLRKQKIAAKEIIENSDRIDEEYLQRNVIKNIHNVTDEFKNDEIIDALKAVRKKSKEKDERKLTMAVFALLKGEEPKKKGSKSKRQPVVSHDEMRRELLIGDK